MKHTQNKPVLPSVLAALAAGVVIFSSTDTAFSADFYPPRYEVTAAKSKKDKTIVRKKRAYTPIAPKSVNLNPQSGASIQTVAMDRSRGSDPYPHFERPAPTIAVNTFNPFYTDARIPAPPIPPQPMIDTPNSPDDSGLASSQAVVDPPISVPELVVVEEAETEKKPVVKTSTPKKTSSRSPWSRFSSSRSRGGSSCKT
jgi:hypothetical protein